MKIFLFIIVWFATTIPTYFYILGIKSRKGSTPGMENNLLKKCPGFGQTCICSEYPEDKKKFHPPIDISSVENALKTSVQVLEDMGCVITEQKDNYIASTTISKLYKFVDDIEIRLDEATNQLHIRSASRVGQHDVFANLKRVKEFNRRFAEASQS